MENHQVSSVEIRSREGNRCLRLHSRDSDYFIASIEGDTPQGAVEVWGYTDCDLLVDLFVSMARDWKGWQGERSWGSIEGDLVITATATRTGVITLRVKLTHHNGVDDWSVSAPIFIEAGQLESLSRRVASFFS